LANGVAALAEDFSPISDMRATADYRLLACQNLLKRFYLETRHAAPLSVYSYGR
jgi:xanthine dehydrogenase small subunit